MDEFDQLALHHGAPAGRVREVEPWHPGPPYCWKLQRPTSRIVPLSSAPAQDGSHSTVGENRRGLQP